MKYDNIINLPHHVSKRKPRMSLYERSAQFAPFDALEGYMEGVYETSRLTDRKIELSEEEIIILNDKLNIINSKIKSNPKIKIVYFVKDPKKDGGKYLEKEFNVKKIDTINNQIIFIDNTKININDILNIEINN